MLGQLGFRGLAEATSASTSSQVSRGGLALGPQRGVASRQQQGPLPGRSQQNRLSISAAPFVDTDAARNFQANRRSQAPLDLQVRGP